jgi:hypothetical protein
MVGSDCNIRVVEIEKLSQKKQKKKQEEVCINIRNLYQDILKLLYLRVVGNILELPLGNLCKNGKAQEGLKYMQREADGLYFFPSYFSFLTVVTATINFRENVGLVEPCVRIPYFGCCFLFKVHGDSELIVCVLDNTVHNLGLEEMKKKKIVVFQ